MHTAIITVHESSLTPGLKRKSCYKHRWLKESCSIWKHSHLYHDQHWEKKGSSCHFSPHFGLPRPNQPWKPSEQPNKMKAMKMDRILWIVKKSVFYPIINDAFSLLLIESFSGPQNNLCVCVLFQPNFQQTANLRTLLFQTQAAPSPPSNNEIIIHSSAISTAYWYNIQQISVVTMYTGHHTTPWHPGKRGKKKKGETNAILCSRWSGHFQLLVKTRVQIYSQYLQLNIHTFSDNAILTANSGDTLL